MDWPVTEVSVFGEPPVLGSTTEVTFEQALNPSIGPAPSFGNRSSEYIDGDTFLYVLELAGDIPNFLGIPSYQLGDQRLIKVGRSNDVTRRLGEIKSGFPTTAKLQWKLRLNSKPFASAHLADEAEKNAHQIFAQIGKSQGNEFFLCSDKLIDSAFAKLVSSTTFKIIALK